MMPWLTFAAVFVLASAGAVAAQTPNPDGLRPPAVARAAGADSDGDADGLPDEWETQLGLDATSSAGMDGAAGDPDGDGLTNLQEFQAGAHPRGTVTRYLAEGVTNTFFETSIALLNPSIADAHVLLRFLRSDATKVSYALTIPGGTRHTVRPATVAGMANADFSTVIESDGMVIVDRTTAWGGTRYGSHSDTAVRSPSPTWYLAEGSTSGDFSLFYLLQNPNPVVVQATVRYLLPFGEPPIEKSYTLPAESRTTIYVDMEGGALAGTDVSAVISADAPIIVERAMYKDKPGQPFAAGHDSAGVTQPALEWFLAEGATGPFFDEFVLIANPNAAAAEIAIDYLLLGGGRLTKTHTVPANGRFTIWVDDEELPAGSGQKPLANVAVSATVRSTNGVPVIVERAMWWPGPEVSANFWYEAHNSPGATSTGTRWAIAEGEVGGPWAMETYILVANTSDAAGQARVTLFFEDGSSTQRTYDLPARSRTNVAVGPDLPIAAGRTFGAVVDSVGEDPVQIVVERAMYSNVPGDVWSSGTNALATVLQSSGAQQLDRTEGPSGTILSLHGQGFSPMTVVMFGNTRVPARVVSDTEVRFIVPFETSTASLQPLAPADAVPVLVDGQLVRTFKVTPLPDTGMAPGQVLSSTIVHLSQDWAAMRSEVLASLMRVRDAMPDDAVRSYVNELISLLDFVDSGYGESLPGFAASLAPTTLSLLERALAHRGRGLAAAQQSAGAAASTAGVARSGHAGGAAIARARRASAILDTNAFLEARRPFVAAANDADDAGLLLDAICAIGTPTAVVPLLCAASAGALGVSALMFDAAVSEIGAISEFRIREGGRQGDSRRIRVLVPPGGAATISASIKVKRTWSAADPLILTLTRILNLSKTGRILPSEEIYIKKIERLLQGYTALKRLGWVDLAVPLSDEEELPPFDLRYVDVTPGGSSQPFGFPAVRIETTGRVVPLVDQGFQDAAFSLKTTIATNAESTLSYDAFFRVRTTVMGKWSGTYQYGANCANYRGIETLDLKEDVDGRVTGRIIDDVLSPTAGATGGSASGTHDPANGAVFLFYSYTFGSVAGVTSRFSGTLSGDTLTGIAGNCGGGTSLTLTRVP